MAKPTKHATLICSILSLLAAAGIAAGIYYDSVLIIMGTVFPTIIYEVYRTEGKTTKYAARGLLVTFIAEAFVLIKDISFDLSTLLQSDSKEVLDYNIPLSDIKTVGPILMAVLSIFLIRHTRGIYTKWLAIIIIIASWSIVYLLNPEVFTSFTQTGVEELLDTVNTLQG